MKEVTIEDVLLKHGIYPNSMMPEYRNGILAAMTEYASLNRQGWTRVEDGYWKQRCEAAELVLSQFPREVLSDQAGEWHLEWEELKNKNAKGL